MSFTVWFTGLPSSGKTTLARALEDVLVSRGRRVEILDGDVVRRALWPELGWSRADRDTNVARVGYLAELLTRHGVVVLVALVSPYRAARAAERERLRDFVEVFVDCSVEECIRRDVKGLYAAQRTGQLRGVTGVDDPYEPALQPEVHLRTDQLDVGACVGALVSYLEASGRT